ncbi:MAG TPA: GNAT family N-acyltransferase [Acidiferrobacter sp.]|nr:GNAT family N-acyltransferase [Acidiferrobacter sp.]
MIAESSREWPLRVEFANTTADIAEVQRLRHQVFVGELGATINDCDGNRDHEYDRDRFDPHCVQLVVRANHGPVVACARILTTETARHCGGFYSESEFDLTPILALPGRIMEVGRVCVHPDHRQGPAIALLLSGLADFLEDHAYDYLIGCGSVPLSPDREQALRTVATLIRRYGCPDALRVAPRNPLPQAQDSDGDDGSATPALLRAYTRLGAYIGGPACLDPDFGVADVLILLFRTRFDRRYLERLLGRTSRQRAA